MNGVIEGYVGTEGGGKTLLMTYFLYRCYKKGIKIYAFPGYELLDKDGKAVSETITPMEFLKNFQDMRNIALAIDEITNYGIDSYSYNGILSRIFGYGAAMRRKLGLIILYTVQSFTMIPPRIRFFTHTLMFCKDLYFGRQYSENPIPRGQSILTRRMDMKGFYTGKERWLGRAQVLNRCNTLWNRYNTEAIVDPRWGLKKYTREDILGEWGGSPLPQGFQLPEGVSNPQEFVKQNLEGLNPVISYKEKEELISMWVEQAVMNGITELPADTVKERIRLLGVDIHPAHLGRMLTKFGVKYRQTRAGYFYNFESAAISCK